MIKQALDAYALKASRDPSTLRATTVGASEIGQCARKVYWRKRGGPEDRGYAQSYGAALRGSTIERAFWEPALRARYGGRLLWSGEDQRSFADGGWLSATPDGLVTGLTEGELAELGVTGSSVVVECKSVDPRASLREAKAENVYQVQVQLGLIRELTEHRPEHAVISYVDASSWDQVTEAVVRFDPKVYEAAKARAARIMTAASPAELQPEGYVAGGAECRWCPYTRACARVSQPPAEAKTRGADPQLVAEVTDLCLEVLAAKDQLSGAEVKVKELQQQVKDRLREKDLRKIDGVVQWSTVKGRQSWDMPGLLEAARTAGVDVERFGSVGEPTDRLLVDRRIEAQRDR